MSEYHECFLAMAHNLLLGILFYPLWAQKSAKPSHFQPIWQDKAAFWKSKSKLCGTAKTPQQMRAGFKPFRLTAHLRKLIPSERLPITAGRIHVIRKVDPQGTMTMFNESWSVHKKWMGEYVWATIDTAQQQIDFWHRPDSESDWIHIQTRAFHLKEPVQKLLPEFYRNRARCREQLPG